MHPEDHRGNGNYKDLHPNRSKPSKIDRRKFDKQRKEYWEKEYPSLPPSSVKPIPKD